MRVLRAALLLLLLLALFSSAVRADYDIGKVGRGQLTISGSFRAREEVWNWFAPGLVSNGQSDHRYHFLGGFVRLGARYQLDGITLYGESMTPYVVSLPDDAQAPAPAGALGLGANYYQPNLARSAASVFLKQGYVRFGECLAEGLDFTGGRFEFRDGAEFSIENSELNWIQRNRISQRLVGNFGFSDVMRSFDGAVANYGSKYWQATVMYGVPTKGAFDLQGMNEVRSTDVIYASVNAGPNEYWGNSAARVFYIYYDDGRRLAPVDNRPLAVRNADHRHIEIHTAGMNYSRTIVLGPGVGDVMLWGAGQLGSWGRLDHQAWAAAAESGYRFIHAPWKPWFRIGYTTTSGDGNPSDSTHGTFFQLLPTPRGYAMFPFFNLMNLNDAMAQLVMMPSGAWEIQSALHNLWLSSASDLWYSGGGAFDDKLFGYAGRPSSGRSYLATLLDCQVSWKLNRNLSIEVYYAHAFGGGVVSAIYPRGKEADYGYIEARFSL